MKATYPKMIVCAAAVASAPVLWADAASAAETGYPARPIRIIVTSTPGSGPDIVARLIGQRLTDTWGQQVVVDARPGASGMIGAEIAARASPDGYTFMIATAQHAIVQAMYEGRIPYHIAKDFTPVAPIATTPFLLLVHPSVPAASVKELVAVAKAKPGELRFGSGGAGSPPHLSAEIFKSMTGIDMLHVPYKGVTPALNDTIAGHVQLTFAVIPASLPHVKARRLNALGITSANRSPLVPDVPTIGESVPGYEFIGYYSLVAPAKTPASIVARVNGEVVKALGTAEFRERLSNLGAEPTGGTPQDLAGFTRAQLEKMSRAVKQSGARPE